MSHVNVGLGQVKEKADIYRRHSEKHDDELFLAKYRMADKGIRKACESTPALLNEECICCNVVAVDCDSISCCILFDCPTRLTGDSLRRQQRKLPKRISLMQAVQEPDKIAITPDDLAVAPHARYFVVPVLKQEDSLFLIQRIDGDNFFHTSACGLVGACNWPRSAAIASIARRCAKAIVSPRSRVGESVALSAVCSPACALATGRCLFGGFVGG